MSRAFTLNWLSVCLVCCGGRALIEGNSTEIASGGAATQGTAAAGAQMSVGAAQSVAGAPAGGNDASSECDHDEDCALVPKGCCGNYEPVEYSQLDAVNSVQVDAYHAEHCPEASPCLAGRASTEYDETLKYFRAVCVSTQVIGGKAHGSCKVSDVRGTPFTRCVTSAECTLRDGADCCRGCDGHGWVPVRSDLRFCGSAVECDECVSLPPESLKVSCQAGMCRFVSPLR